MRVTLLGPQRRPTVDKVVAALPGGGPIATITAGWQEREPDDGELSKLLGSRDVNLALYRRWLDVQDRTPEFFAAERRLRGLVEEAQEIYLLRLDHALQAVYAVQRRSTPDPLRAGVLAEAISAVRDLDSTHLRRVSGLAGEFYQRWQPHDLPVVAEHRNAIARLLGEAAAVVIAGGHVGVLADTLHLFGVAPSLRSPVIAWSAGAMALTDRVVLFNDRSPQGPGHPEVYRTGLRMVPKLVALPHASARLLLGDTQRMAVFARRFAPARCVLLEQGTRVDTDGEGTCPPGTRVLGLDGQVTPLGEA